MERRANGRPEEPADFNGRRQSSVDGTSRMNREVHVRICERLGVKCPGPTRHSRLGGASWRSSHVRNAPLATVGPKKAACRDGPNGDIKPTLKAAETA